MKSIFVYCIALASLSASADEQRVYHVDGYGNVQYSKPSYNVSREIVALDSEGRPSFQVLQHRSAHANHHIAFYACAARLDRGSPPTCVSFEVGAREVQESQLWT